MDYAPVIAVFGVLIFLLWLAAGWLAWRWTWLLGWLKGSVIMLLAAGGLLLGVMAYDLAHWNRASDGTAVAHISIDRSSGPVPTVKLSLLGGGDDVKLEFNGDFLEMEVQTLDWEGPFSAAGLAYRPSILRSRFDAIENNLNWADAGQQTYTIVPAKSRIDLWSVLHGTGLGKRLEGLVSAGTESVNYVPMVDGALYAVVFRNGRLVAEPLNDPARRASAL